MHKPNICELGGKLEGIFFFLPSSVHETIVVPDDGNMEYKELLAMAYSYNKYGDNDPFHRNRIWVCLL